MKKLFSLMRIMEFHMFGFICKQLQIFRSIILLIFNRTKRIFSSFMMNHFRWDKITTNHFFHDKMTSSNITSIISIWMRGKKNKNIWFSFSRYDYPFIIRVFFSFFKRTFISISFYSFVMRYMSFYRNCITFMRTIFSKLFSIMVNFKQLITNRTFFKNFIFFIPRNHAFLKFTFRRKMNSFFILIPRYIPFFKSAFWNKAQFFPFIPWSLSFFKWSTSQHNLLLIKKAVFGVLKRIRLYILHLRLPLVKQKKIALSLTTIIISFLFLFCQEIFAIDEWTKGSPAGTDSASDIDAKIQTNNAALDRLLYLERTNCAVMADTVATVTILPGTIAIPNSAGSVVRYRRNTSSISLSFSNLDTGSEAASTQYYIYANADGDTTTFTGTISTSSSAPTGVTYYRQIGYLYNNSSSNITNVGNIKQGDVPNIMKVTGTSDISTESTTFTDMTDMEIRFVCSGRPVEVIFNAPLDASSSLLVTYVIDIDGTDKIQGVHEGTDEKTQSLVWLETLSAGAHTIKVQWKVATGTGYQRGNTDGARILIVQEH